MIILNEWANKALEKLEKEKGAVTGQKETAMKGAVLETIKDFCRQDAEFAQAVVQGGTFKDCMTAVAKGVGNSISDLDAYKKAVQFYFPGAKVRMQLSIERSDKDVREERPETEPVVETANQNLILDLASFF